MSRARDLADSADLAFDGNTLKIDSTNNRVGIGTDSPSTDFHLHNSGAGTNSEILLTNGDTGSTSTDGFKIALNTGAGGEVWNYENDYIRFGTNNTEAMRIDSSGNLLVGTTQHPSVLTSTSTYEGLGYEAQDYLSIARSSGGCLHLNRLSTDGEIATFRKDGTTVGSINASSGRVAVFNGDGHGIRIGTTSSEPDILPMVSSAFANGAGNLGQSSYRWKDLYLSGGVYLGGTGSANYLDDYEEGTWTPVLTPNAGSGYTFTVNHATYTKIGRAVHLVIKLTTTTVGTASGGLNIDGKPFTALTETAIAGENLSTGGTYSGMVSSGGGLIYTYPGSYVNGYSYTISATYFTS